MMGKQMRDEIYLIQGNLFAKENKRKKKEKAKSETKKNESNKAHYLQKDNIFCQRKKVMLTIN